MLQDVYAADHRLPGGEPERGVLTQNSCFSVLALPWYGASTSDLMSEGPAAAIPLGHRGLTASR